MKALFLIGGPGSGKDAVLRGTALNDAAITEVSLAQLFEAITEQKSLRCVDTDQPVIVNGNADDLNKVLICKKVLENMEYKTACLFVYTTNEESKKRNDQRARLGARTFTEQVRANKYEASFKNIKPLEEVFKNFTLFDNSFNPTALTEEQKQEVAGWIHELNVMIKGFFAGKQSVDEQVDQFLEDKQSETGAHKALQQTAQHKVLAHKEKEKNTGMGGYFAHTTQTTAKQVAQKKFDKAANDQRTNNSGQTVRNSPTPVVTGPSHLSGKSKVNEHLAPHRKDEVVAKHDFQQRLYKIAMLAGAGSAARKHLKKSKRYEKVIKANEDVATHVDQKDGKLPDKKKPAKAARAPVQLGDIRSGDGMSATATFAYEDKQAAMQTALAGHSDVEHHTDCPLCLSHMEHGVHKTHASANKEHRHHVDLAHLHGDLAEDLGGGTIPNSTFTQVAAAAAGHPQTMKKPKTLKKLKLELATKSPDGEFGTAQEVYEDWGVESQEAMFEGRAIRTNKPFKANGGYAVYVTDGRTVNRLTFNKKAGYLTEEVALTDAKFWETLR